MKKYRMINTFIFLILVQHLNADWQYRQTISIAPADTILTDYQLLLTLTPGNFDYTHSESSSGQDLRFSTDGTGNAEPDIHYWIEEWNENDTSRIWVKVSTVSNVDTTILYLYFGNSTASSTSNGDSTFIFFDDFEDNVWTDKWIQSRLPATSSYSGNDYEYALISESNGLVTFTDCCQNDGICPQGAGVLISNESFTINRESFVFDVKGSIATSSGGLSALSANVVGDTMFADPFPIWDRLYGVGPNTFGTDISVVFYPVENNIFSELITYDLGSIYRHVVRYNGSTEADLRIYDSNGHLVGSRLDSYTYSDSSIVRVMLYVESPGSFFNEIKLYQYADPEPLVYYDIEESGNWFLSPIENSLVAYYPFNGNANDESGNGYNGVAQGGLTLTNDRFENPNSAYYFDGVDDYIDVIEESNFDFGINNFTLSSWIFSNTNSTCRIIAKSNHNTDDGYQLGISDSAHFYLLDSEPVTRSHTLVNDSIWHHIVGIRSDDTIKIFIDGALEDFVVGVSGWDVNNDHTLKIGRRDGAQQALFEGVIDDIRIYNGALSVNEILDLYHENGWRTQDAIVNVNSTTVSDGDTVLVAVSVDNQNTLLLNSTEFVFADYTSGLTFLEVDTANTLLGSAGWMIAVNETDTGLNVAGAGSNEITEDGVLFNLKFLATGNVCETIPVNIADILFNTGDDSVLVEDGSVYIGPVPVYGDVDENEDVQAYDAAMILEHLVGEDTLICQGLANAEVSLNDTLSAFDASLILQYVVDSIDTLPYTQPLLASGDISISENIVGANQPLSIPIEFINGSNIYSIEGSITFDEVQMQYEGIEIFGLSNNAIQTQIEDNMIKFAFASAESIDVDGELGNIQFMTTSNFEGSSITIEYLQINENLHFENITIDVLLGTEDELSIPTTFALHQNYPNPFNPTTTLHYDLPKDSNVRIVVFDVMGREVSELVSGELVSGKHQIVWNGKNSSGADMPTGMYFAKMTTSEYSKTIKMILMK